MSMSTNSHAVIVENHMGKVDECLLSQALLAYNWKCEKCL